MKYYILKWLAIFAMVCDHSAILFLEDGVLCSCLRGFGRIAFPIFGYLMICGFSKRVNHLLYIRRLLLLAVLSEIPYDVFMTQRLFDLHYQNVCFLLLLAYCFLWLIESGQLQKICRLFFPKRRRLLDISFYLTLFGLFGLVAYLCRMDYSYSGFSFLILLYFLEKKPKRGLEFLLFFLFGICCKNLLSLCCIFALLPIWMLPITEKKKLPQAVTWLSRLAYPLQFIFLIVVKVAIS